MTTLVQIAETQSNKATTANENFYAAAPAALFAAKLSECVGLTWSYYGGYILIGSTPTLIADGTLSLTDNTVNYIEANSSGSLFATIGSPTGFTSGRKPLYVVTTSGGLVTSYVDVRMFALQALP